METPCPKFGDNKIYQFPLKELKITPAMTRFHQSFLKVDSYKKKHSTNEMHEYVEMAYTAYTAYTASNVHATTKPVSSMASCHI